MNTTPQHRLYYIICVLRHGSTLRFVYYTPPGQLVLDSTCPTSSFSYLSQASEQCLVLSHVSEWKTQSVGNAQKCSR